MNLPSKQKDENNNYMHISFTFLHSYFTLHVNLLLLVLNRYLRIVRIFAINLDVNVSRFLWTKLM